MEAIKGAVWSYLPGLPDDLLTTLIDELGVESVEDLALMEEKDLVRYLKPIQCRKLLNGIKQGFVTINMEVLSPHPIASSSANTLASPQAFQPPHHLLSSPPSSTPSTSSSGNTLASPQAFRPPHHLLSSPPSTSSSSQSPQPGMPWHVDFRVNWNQMPTAIQQAVAKEERPMPDERRAFVNALVDQMMQHECNPTRAMCHSIVRLIVRSHPKSFADISRRGEVVGDGCPSLLQQVKTRVEYKARNNTLARRRRSREGRRNTGVAGESRLTRGPVDQYGYV
ncbi:hypothetical protein CgunFtcFv8_020076 [Champsocephalus gunnari]|uniref:Uncharacterized protein n=1 Tax=Champsocephalus gunnari TaxID=52237 RepID=A0AAN8DHD4_CHAGU|nr:hypothetical protein CgunFtcFv8_020076 [Champsocephalus gunnari]